MPRQAPLADRIARWEQISAMAALKMSHELIGQQLDPPLTKARVQQIIANGRPGRNGRPPGPKRREVLERRLRYWMDVLQRSEAGGNHGRDEYARERIAAISTALAELPE